MILLTLMMLSQTLQDSAPAPLRLVHRQTLAARYNPLGLVWEGRLGLRFRLHDSDSAALRDNFLSIGIVPSASPAFARIGALAELQPASFVNVYALYEAVQYFGTFSTLRSYQTAQADFSDSAAKREPAHYAAGGTQLTVGVNLQAKVGPVAARAQLKAVRPDFALRAGDTVEYDLVSDLVMPNRGWTVLGDVDALVQLKSGFIAGARFTFGLPVYHAGVENPIARLGPFAGYTFRSVDGAAFNQPTVLLMAQWWLVHRYRTGADTSTAIPCVMLAFTFNGDLLDTATKPAP